MPDWTFHLSDLVYICGAVATIWGIVKIIKEIKKPSDDLKETVDHHGECLHNDKIRIDSMEQEQRLICRSLLAMINHELTGNSVDKLKEMRDDLQNYLINK